MISGWGQSATNLWELLGEQPQALQWVNLTETDIRKEHHIPFICRPMSTFYQSLIACWIGVAVNGIQAGWGTRSASTTDLEMMVGQALVGATQVVLWQLWWRVITKCGEPPPMAKLCPVGWQMLWGTDRSLPWSTACGIGLKRSLVGLVQGSEHLNKILRWKNVSLFPEVFDFLCLNRNKSLHLTKQTTWDTGREILEIPKIGFSPRYRNEIEFA